MELQAMEVYDYGNSGYGGVYDYAGYNSTFIFI